jgi:hypothetical protein
MSNNEQNKEARANNWASTRLLLITMADTTWRMFVAPAILVTAGIFGDIQFKTAPWLTALGLCVGLGMSALLVRQQLRGTK